MGTENTVYFITLILFLPTFLISYSVQMVFSSWETSNGILGTTQALQQHQAEAEPPDVAADQVLKNICVL
jgi:hypothetical protein